MRASDAQPYPLETLSRRPKGWRQSDQGHLTHTKQQWRATVVPRAPGQVRLFLIKDFDDADEAMSIADAMMSASSD